ncbi:MAG: flippase-like domain-containing protein [Lachnospiraceae bacterium]|nr:flippase-like domain-containing protein [Lachnospiraceae bacterium]
MDKKGLIKKILVVFFFVLVMGLTFYAVFSGTDPKVVWKEICRISHWGIAAMLLSVLCYIGTEGFKIWLLMDGVRKLSHYFKCCGYALIEFFYGGITPSASGGQPIQLLYMKKDGYSFTKGCAAMSFNAVTNKFVLAFSGLMILLFWKQELFEIFGGYIGWYFLGWLLLIGWTLILFLFIFNPNTCQKAVLKLVGIPVKMHLIKNREKTDGVIIHFFDAYRSIVALMKEKKAVTVAVFLLSFLQRFFLLLVTYWVYVGLHLKGSSFVYIMLVQLVVVISSDMIPLPGAQGISEYIYHKVFLGVFGEAYLTTSMCASRGVNFYFILFMGLLVVVARNFQFKKHHTTLREEDCTID